MVPPSVGIYTAIYGGYNSPKPVPNYLEGHARLLTDSIATAHEAERMGWEPEVVRSPYLDMEHDATQYGDPGIVVPMLSHKYWKCHPGEAMADYDISIWVDGSMEVVTDDFIGKCLAALGGDDWSCMPHPARTCIYPEASYSATLTWRYDARSINAQAEHYSHFHPAHWGLIATGFCVRRHTTGVLDLSHEWWVENTQWSHQDQLSLPVLMKMYSDAGKVRYNYGLPWHQWLVHHAHG